MEDWDDFPVAVVELIRSNLWLAALSLLVFVLGVVFGGGGGGDGASVLMRLSALEQRVAHLEAQLGK